MERKIFTLEEKEAVLQKTNGKCAHCGKKLTAETATIEHIYPFSKGGSNSEYNITALCKKCNDNKSNCALSDIPVYFKYIDEQYIDAYCKQFSNEIEINNDNSRFLNYDEQRFYYLPESAMHIIGKMSRRKPLKQKQLIKIINTNMKELTLEPIYDADLYEMLRDYNDNRQKNEPIIDYFQISDNIKAETMEAYLIRTHDFKNDGILILDRLDIEPSTIENKNFQKVLQYTHFKPTYAIHCSMFKNTMSFESIYETVSSFLVVTAISKKILLMDEVLEGDPWEDSFEYNGKYYNFPNIEFLKNELKYNIERTNLAHDEKDQENMIDYLLNHHDQISKQDRQRYQELFHINNLYNQLNPKQITRAKLTISDYMFNSQYSLCELQMW